LQIRFPLPSGRAVLSGSRHLPATGRPSLGHRASGELMPPFLGSERPRVPEFHPVGCLARDLREANVGEGKNLVGIDIGTSSIKVCQLKETRKSCSLVRFGYTDLAPQTIVDGQVMDAGAVVEGLMRVFRDARIKQKEVALSVSGQTVIIRKIAVPIMTAAELDEQIHWEAEQHIPFKIEDVQIDYQVLRRRPEASQMDLLLVAAKRDQIGDYAQLARDAKLKPVVCDIDAFTVQNMFEFSRGLPTDESVALINVGASLSSLNIIANGISSFTREIANGGNVITEEIQKQLQVPYEQAEAYKCGGAGAPDDADQAGMIPQQVAQVIETVVDSVAAEIQRSLDFFMATSGEGELTRIYARVPVETWLATEQLAIQTQTIDTALLERRAAQLPVALGLALRKEREVAS
jgi:type IV pilus assembly protein PilM